MSAVYRADIHIHSRFSRACSKNLLLPNIAEVAAEKGLHLLGTGDFTHPAWFAMMQEDLEMNDRGFYESRSAHPRTPVDIIPTAEIACIYKKHGKVRRLHMLVVAPTLGVVEVINRRLGEIGNLKADGRPILGLDAQELAKIVLDVSPQCLVIPAHAWTPWFSVFGSKSGFDSLEECFDDMAKEIPAIETGLSSDPLMNARLSSLDSVTLLSNSDAHSLENLGREATVFSADAPMTYDRFSQMIWRHVPGYLGTIEFFPEEGKYHVDGHATCNVRLTPAETKQHHGRCPSCGKAITVGVLHRVDDLADRVDAMPKFSFQSIVPLREVLGEVVGVGKKSKAVDRLYRQLVPVVGTEFDVLLSVPIATIAAAAGAVVADAIDRVRAGKLVISPGYDGVYGTVRIYEEGKRPGKHQVPLFQSS